MIDQYWVEKYFIDLYFPDHRLGVEIDENENTDGSEVKEQEIEGIIKKITYYIN